MFRFHILAFVAGFILDLIVGDPYCLPHPIRLIGNGIIFLEKRFLKVNKQEDEDKKIDVNRQENLNKQNLRNGMILVISMLVLVTVSVASLLILAYCINCYLGLVIEAIMTYQILATKCLKVESMKVYKELVNGTLEQARYAVSMIVGRDTNVLDEKGVTKAAVETIAENLSDGVIAPLIYTAIGGPILGFAYKTINTCDSMIGYKNDKYMYFGRFGAKLDDVVNYIPARISGILIVIACAFMGKDYSLMNSFRIFKRDRFNHASPNSAQTESAMAGALGIQLAGDAWYFGKLHKKQFIGDKTREIEYEDIKRANRLLYTSTFMAVIVVVCCMVLLCLYLM